MLAIGVASMSAQLLQNRGAGAAGQSKVVCLYNSTSFLREGMCFLFVSSSWVVETLAAFPFSISTPSNSSRRMRSEKQAIQIVVSIVIIKK